MAGDASFQGVPRCFQGVFKVWGNTHGGRWLGSFLKCPKMVVIDEMGGVSGAGAVVGMAEVVCGCFWCDAGGGEGGEGVLMTFGLRFLKG